MRSLQSLQEVETLLGFLGSEAGIEGLGEVFYKMNFYHSSQTSYQCSVESDHGMLS